MRDAYTVLCIWGAVVTATVITAISSPAPKKQLSLPVKKYANQKIPEEFLPNSSGILFRKIQF
jgi:hypothetical protein